jgi:hypothetical protein
MNIQKDTELTDLLNEDDPPYESAEELRIGRALDEYGIPFFYRKPTVIMNPADKHNEIWQPSFTLPQYGCSVIDYIAEQKQAAERIDIYRYNQIPATVIGPKDLDKPNFEQSLYQKLKEEFCRWHNPMAYKEQ